MYKLKTAFEFYPENECMIYLNYVTFVLLIRSEEDPISSKSRIQK